MEDLSQDLIDAFVVAARGDLATVQTLAARHPELLAARTRWDETAPLAATHTGSREVVRYLRARGLEPDGFTDAVLGEVERLAAHLDRDPALVHTGGAHGIPLRT